MSAEMSWIHDILRGYIICYFIALGFICITLCLIYLVKRYQGKKPEDSGEKKEQLIEATPTAGEPDSVNHSVNNE